MITKQDIDHANEQIKYLEGLVHYYEENPHDDDSSIDFLTFLLAFKTRMSLVYNPIHKYCNRYVKENIAK